MKSININDFIKAGQVFKPHGNKGFLKVSILKNIQIKEWVMLKIQQKPVPFFIESQQKTNEDELIIKLLGINTVEQAEELLGYEILVEKGLVKRKKGAIDFTLIGFKLIDEQAGEIGEVLQMEELPGQLLLVSHYKNKEVLIPAVDEFIKEIDEKKRIVYLRLPEGLL